MKTTRTGIRAGVAVAATAILALALGATAGATSDHDRWLGLAGGHIGHYTWTVEAKPQSRERPCLLVGRRCRSTPSTC